MTCIICASRRRCGTPRPADPGWWTCRLCAAQLTGQLRTLPDLCGALDVAPGAPTGAPRVSGSPTPPLPVRVDAVDLLAAARAGSVAVHVRSPWPGDQTGHLSVATVLDFWARDWAALRREHPPQPSVTALAGWLADRVDWAAQAHPAIDETAEEIRRLRGALRAACGLADPPREHLAAPCPECGRPALHRDADADAIACDRGCGVLLTEDDYAAWCRRLIAEESDAA